MPLTNLRTKTNDGKADVQLIKTLNTQTNMKSILIIILTLFITRTQAQQQVSAEFRAKMKQMQTMSQKMQQPKGKTGGKITYNVNGKTYTETKEVSTAIIEGKISDISNANHTVSIGDGQIHAFKKGQSYVCNGLIVMVDGVKYSRRSKDNVATITFYDGKTVKGTFSGTVYNEKTKKTLPISGTFETNNVMVL